MGGKFGTTLHPSKRRLQLHGRSYVDNSFQRGQIYCYLCWLVSLKGGSEHSYGKKKAGTFPCQNGNSLAHLWKIAVGGSFVELYRRQPSHYIVYESIVMKLLWYNPTKDAYLPIQHHQEETRHRVGSTILMGYCYLMPRYLMSKLAMCNLKPDRRIKCLDIDV